MAICRLKARERVTNQEACQFSLRVSVWGTETENRSILMANIRINKSSLHQRYIEIFSSRSIRLIHSFSAVVLLAQFFRCNWFRRQDYFTIPSFDASKIMRMGQLWILVWEKCIGWRNKAFGGMFLSPVDAGLHPKIHFVDFRHASEWLFYLQINIWWPIGLYRVVCLWMVA